jgi:hypothetical protein
MARRAEYSPGVGDNGPAFRIGDRVMVRRDSRHGPGPWPAEPTGIIARHPDSGEGEAWVWTKTTSGPGRVYWIVFDSPQFDVEGDGPYSMSEVLDKYVARAAIS